MPRPKRRMTRWRDQERDWFSIEAILQTLEKENKAIARATLGAYIRRIFPLLESMKAIQKIPPTLKSGKLWLDSRGVDVVRQLVPMVYKKYGGDVKNWEDIEGKLEQWAVEQGIFSPPSPLPIKRVGVSLPKRKRRKEEPWKELLNISSIQGSTLIITIPLQGQGQKAIYKLASSILASLADSELAEA